MLEIEEKPLYIGDTNKVPLIALNKNLPRFSSIKELEDVIKENTYFITNDYMKESAVEDVALNVKAESTNGERKNVTEYSKTNVQVENVDEADIVKTDGEYIYYTTQNIVYIIKADNLQIVKEIDLYGEKNVFYHLNYM